MAAGTIAVHGCAIIWKGTRPCRHFRRMVRQHERVRDMNAGHNGDLAALVGSRICHDLVGPLGAIGNGVELLALTGARGEEMDLIAEAVASAHARLRFFRIAYGAADAGQMIPRGEVIQTLAAVSHGGRVSFLWAVDGDCPRDEVRAVFLALQCLETALPHGGEAQVSRLGTQWTVTGESPRLQVDDSLWSLVEGSHRRPALAPAQVQFALLPDTLAALRRKLTLSRMGGQLTMRF